VGQRERQEAQILQQSAPGRSGIRRRVGDVLVVDTSSRRLAEKKDGERRIDQQDIFDRMVLFLAALTCGLCSRVLGADNPSFGAVMGTRGEAGAAAGAEDGRATVAVSASETPSRCASAVRERVGASPRVRRALSNTGKRTWIH
jgi:hypothetical protein